VQTTPDNDGTRAGLNNHFRAKRTANITFSAGLMVLLLASGPAGLAQESSTTTTSTTSTVAPDSSSSSIPGPTTTAPPATSTASTVPGSTVPATAIPGSTVPAPTTPGGSALPATTVPSASTTVVPTPPTTTVYVPTIKVPKNGVLKVGSKGDAVQALEERLEELMIDTGKVDGRFDWSTWQGVVAFQKYNGYKRDGKVTTKLARLIEESLPLNGARRVGATNRLEVDLTRQLTFLYRDGALYRVISVSTGSGKKYCEIGKSGNKVCGSATTPVGNYRIQRRISGWRISELGRLYNPLYFNGGIAFHGAPSVPAYPASHGCVRLPMSIAEWFPSKVSNGWPVSVYR
jgi:peptidoglycan hydrolase-like protein with peptidoglycan-binding domain